MGQDGHELSDLDVVKIGVVTGPAIRRKLLVIKQEDAPLLAAFTEERLGLIIGKLEELKAGIGTLTADEIREKFRAAGNGLWTTEDDMVAMAKSLGIDLVPPATIEPDKGITTTKRDPMPTKTTAVELLKRDDLSDDLRAALQKSVDDDATAAATAAAEVARLAKAERDAAAGGDPIEALLKRDDIDPGVLAVVKAQRDTIAGLHTGLTKAAVDLATERTVRKGRDMVAIAKRDYPNSGKDETVGALLLKLETQLDGDTFAEVTGLLKRQDKLAGSSTLLKSEGYGEGNDDEPETANGKLTKIAKSLHNDGGFESYELAYTAAMERNPKLYAQHVAETTH